MPPNFVRCAVGIIDHLTPFFRSVTGAVDPHYVHAAADQFAHEVIPFGRFAGHRHHDSDSATWQRRTQQLSRMLLQQ
jgi:hypothetical protein